MVAAPQHSLILRGAPAELWAHIQSAIHDGVEPPLEWCAGGPAGTGKSWGILSCFIALASMYPKVPGRVLIARRTRRSLTNSACSTVRKILYPGHPMLSGPNDEHRSVYRLGRWEFVLAGMNDPDNLLSSEWDFIYFQELRQLALKPWERFSRGVRNYALYRYNAAGELAAPGEGVSRIPFGMAVACTNPGKKKSWILKRAKETRLRLLSTTLEENPAYFDDRLRITPMGETYRNRMVRTYTGLDFRRMVKGEWCSGEGAIWPAWNDDLDDPKNSNTIQIERDSRGWITREQLLKLDIRSFYGGLDPGDDAAGCFLLAGLTGDHKLIVIAEAYARKKDLDWWTARIKEIHEHYPITLCFCDHNRVDMVRAFNDVVGAPREGPGAVFINADKGVDRGLALTGLRIARRSLLVDVDTLVHTPDAYLAEASIPTCLLDEIEDYVHDRDEEDDDEVSQDKPKDRPDPDCHDHGCDALRYLVVGVENMDADDKLPDPKEHEEEERYQRLRRITAAPGTDPDDEDNGNDPEQDWLADRLPFQV